MNELFVFVATFGDSEDKHEAGGGEGDNEWESRSRRHLTTD